ncbi:MAG: diguanylate cyclase [Elusimicrobiota bacterium]|nr:diguanylate cyclase [Elusimicrobiota bacterium]
MDAMIINKIKKFAAGICDKVAESITVKIAIFINLILISGIGAAIIFISYFLYKPLLETNLNKKIISHLDYLSPSIILNLEAWSPEKTEPVMEHSERRNIVNIFMYNPELISLDILNTEGYVYSSFHQVSAIFQSAEGVPVNVSVVLTDNKTRGKKQKAGELFIDEIEKYSLESAQIRSILETELAETEAIITRIREIIVINREVLNKNTAPDKEYEQKIRTVLERTIGLIRRGAELHNTFQQIIETSKFVSMNIPNEKHIRDLNYNLVGIYLELDKRYSNRIDQTLQEINAFKFKKNRALQINTILADLINKDIKTDFVSSKKQIEQLLRSLSVFSSMELRDIKVSEDKNKRNVTVRKQYKPIYWGKLLVGYYGFSVNASEIEAAVSKIITKFVYSFYTLIIILISVLVSGLISFKTIIRPIQLLSNGADEFSENLDFRIHLKRKDEFGKFAGAFNKMAAKLQSAQNELMNKLEEVRKLFKLATEDGLTKTYIHRYIMELFNMELKRAERYHRTTAAAMLDIDFFKAINDRYGHQSGDAILSKLGSVLLKTVRENIDIIGRYGGEEFLIIFPETDKEHAIMACEKLRREIETSEFCSLDGENIEVRVSIGVTAAEGPDAASGEMISRADKALYRSKNSGRNRVTYG